MLSNSSSDSDANGVFPNLGKLVMLPSARTLTLALTILAFVQARDHNVVSLFYNQRAEYPTQELEDHVYEMVQAYGAVHVDHSNPYDDNTDEARALLGSNSRAVGSLMTKKDGHATIVSSVSNLLNTIIGSGTVLKHLYFIAIF